MELLLGTLIKLGTKIVSEKVIKAVAIKLLEALVKSTDNKLDDEILSTVKKAMEE